VIGVNGATIFGLSVAQQHLMFFHETLSRKRLLFFSGHKAGKLSKHFHFASAPELPTKTNS